MSTNYTPANAQLVDGSHGAAKQLEIEAEKQRRAQNAALNQAYTDEEMKKLFGVNTNDFSQVGGLTQEASLAAQKGGTETEYNGQKGWYTYDGQQRTAQEGSAGADEQFLSDGSYAAIQQLKQEYAAAQAAGDTAAMQLAHEQAERIRARAGYSGGADGSWYLTGGELGVDLGANNKGANAGVRNAPVGGTYYADDTPATSGSNSSDDLRSLLSQWQDAALKQSDGKIDYAVAKAVAELERALEDAQPQFKEQAETVAREERQALDNSALYAEARGDKGGIGKEQYNEIQAAAAQNHLAVQQAQTKLSTDTARQIADLRAQGEFEKADAALEIAQSYLSQLIGIEQWAAEFGLSQAQFQESIRQWEAEFNLAMQQFQFNSDLALKQFGVDTDLAYGQLTGTLPSTGQLTLDGQKQLASMGEALLSSGIMPSADQLKAMGMTESQAQSYLTAMQLEAAAKANKSSGTPSSINKTDSEAENAVVVPAYGTDAWKAYIAEQADAAGQSYYDYLYSNRSALNMTTSEISEKAKAVEAYVAKRNVPVRPSVGYITDGSGADMLGSSGGSSYGTRYDDVLSTAREMKNSGKSEATIRQYLNSLSESELTTAGLAKIMAALDLYGYGGM